MQPHESARGPHVLRQINSRAVLVALRENSPARVADLMQATGLSRPAVTRAVAELRDAGLVADVDETAQVSMGRPAQWLRFRAEVGHVVGVDVGSHKVVAMVADLAGKVVASRQIATGSRLLESVRDTIAEALAKADLTGDDVWAIVVGTPGIVEESSGEVLLAPGIPGLAHLPVLDALRTITDSPVLIENDINLAVLGERWCGAAVGSDSLVFVHWGVRIGAGIVIDGKPYRGANGAAGEIGFADVFSELDAPDPAPLLGAQASSVSEQGAFERMVGTQAIAELAEAADALAARSGLLPPDGDARLDGGARPDAGARSGGGVRPDGGARPEVGPGPDGGLRPEVGVRTDGAARSDAGARREVGPGPDGGPRPEAGGRSGGGAGPGGGVRPGVGARPDGGVRLDGGPGGGVGAGAEVGVDRVAVREFDAGSEGRFTGAQPDAVAAVFAAATDGDPAALAVVDRIAARFARGLAAMLLILDPREVIIGGGLSRAGDTLLAAIDRHLRPRILTSPRLVLSDLGSDAVALGAVRRALDHAESRLLS